MRSIHYGDLIVTQSGTTIEDMEITGLVISQAANVTLRNVLVGGDKPDEDTPEGFRA